VEDLLESPPLYLEHDPHRGMFRLEHGNRWLECMAGVEIGVGRRGVSLTTANAASQGIRSQKLEDIHGTAKEAGITYSIRRDLALEVTFRLYRDHPFALCRIEVTNQGSEPIPLRRFFLQSRPDGFLPSEEPRGFYRSGWQSWSHAGFLPAEGREPHPMLPVRILQGPMTHNAATPWQGKQGRFWSETVGAVMTDTSALVLGGVSLADQFVQAGVDLRPRKRSLVLQAQADDVALAPGETGASEWFYLEWVPLPQIDPLATYAHAVARQMEVPPQKPVPTGWCSWYIYRADVSEADIMQNLAMAALLSHELPLEVIQLDEGYESTWGDWTDYNERFDHPLPWLASRIEGSGFTPGLWLSPFTVHPRSEIARAHPDWLLRDHRGRPVSAGLLFSFIGRILDPTHPGVQDHVRQLVETAVEEWGYPYLKLDFLYAAARPGQHHDASVTRAQAYRRGMEIIRQAAGEETFLVGCGAPIGPSVGLVDAMRIGPDTDAEWEPHFAGLRWSIRQNPSLPSLRNSLRNVTNRAWMHNRWWINDPDTLMVRQTQTALTEDEVLAQATLLGLSGGLSILSDDLSELSPERQAIASALLPPKVDRMEVLDLFQEEMPSQVIAPVVRPWGQWTLIGLFNWTNEPVERMLPTAQIPDFDPEEDYHVIDFWNETYRQLVPDEPAPSFELPPHGGMLLSLRGVESGPHIVGTTLHVSQGGEGTSWQIEPGSAAFTLDLGRMAQGEIWLSIPARPTAASWNEEQLDRKAIRAIARGVWAFQVRVPHRGTLTVTWEWPGKRSRTDAKTP
jgi:alpha-galactosidase